VKVNELDVTRLLPYFTMPLSSCFQKYFFIGRLGGCGPGTPDFVESVHHKELQNVRGRKIALREFGGRKPSKIGEKLLVGLGVSVFRRRRN
jgi:hypothetical protein